MALLILALLQRIFLMSSLMMLLVWLIFFIVLITLLPILGTISGKTVMLIVFALTCVVYTLSLHDALPICPPALHVAEPSPFDGAHVVGDGRWFFGVRASGES